MPVSLHNWLKKKLEDYYKMDENGLVKVIYKWQVMTSQNLYFLYKSEQPMFIHFLVSIWRSLRWIYSSDLRVLKQKP